MKVKSKAYINLEYDTVDLITLERAEKLFAQLYHDLGAGDLELVSPYTGELLMVEEIPRVRGIIDALLNTKVWDVCEKDDGD